MAHKVALITGVSSGLGLELAVRLVTGRAVVGLSRRLPSDKRCTDLANTGRCSHIRGDVSDAASVTQAFSAAARAGTLDLVINCAGVGVFGPAGSYARADIDRTLGTNLLGLILVSEAAVCSFRTKGGTLVNVLSTAAQVGRAHEVIYCASRSGIAAFDRLVAHVMSQPPYHDARRVFLVMGNGSSHRGEPCMKRLQAQHPYLVPVHGPSMPVVESDRDLLLDLATPTPNDFASLQGLTARGAFAGGPRDLTGPSDNGANGPLYPSAIAGIHTCTRRLPKLGDRSNSRWPPYSLTISPAIARPRP